MEGTTTAINTSRWDRFKALEAEWNARGKAVSDEMRMARTPTQPGQNCHPGGDTNVTQTQPRNPNKINNSLNAGTSTDLERKPQRQKEHGRKNEKKMECKAQTLRPTKKTPSRRTAHRTAAERRFSRGLFGLSQKDHVRSIELLDDQMNEAAIDAECDCIGGGLDFVLEQLAKAGEPK